MYPGGNQLGLETIRNDGTRHYQVLIQFSIDEKVPAHGEHMYVIWSDWKIGSAPSRRELKKLKRDLSAEVLAYFRVDPKMFGGLGYKGRDAWPSKFQKRDCEEVHDNSRKDANN
eukprot:GEMP01093981.1.p3 GENE.GEMP01093981.1~~GEMP01093981.1.p3  ORF type:complete len:114 (+),score=18.00 GEMP01093981.1:235-576(+)